MTWSEIDTLCSTIKYAPESVDLEVVRSVLRRAQHEIELAQHVEFPSSFSYREVEDGYEIDIKLKVSFVDRDDVIRWLFGVDN